MMSLPFLMTPLPSLDISVHKQLKITLPIIIPLHYNVLSVCEVIDYENEKPIRLISSDHISGLLL